MLLLQLPSKTAAEGYFGLFFEEYISQVFKILIPKVCLDTTLGIVERSKEQMRKKDTAG